MSAGYRSLTTDNVATALWYVRRLFPSVTVIELDGRAERMRLSEFLAADPETTQVVTRLDAAAVAFAQPLTRSMGAACS